MDTLKIESYSDIMQRWKEGKQCAIPSNIPNVDRMIGGLVPGFLSVIWGDSGSGKTLFCCNAIKNTLNKDVSSRILYIDHESNLRLKTLEKMNCDLERIDFFSPKGLVEQIIFCQTLQNKIQEYNLVIIDSLFGSPLDQLKYINLEARFWTTKIFNLLLSLKSFASRLKIPIIVTCHTPNNDKNLEQELLNGFSPVQIFLKKEYSKFSAQFYFYSENVGRSEFISPLQS